MKRAIHARVLYVVLVAGVAFYALCPTVYAFFDMVTMSYGHTPAWVAKTLPAHVTARVFDRYNVRTAAAYLRRELPCYLLDEGATRKDDCTHAIGPGQAVHGPPDLKLASGFYRGRFDFSQDAVCSDGKARLQITAVGRGRNVLATTDTDIRPGDRIELPFTLKPMAAALDTVEFSVQGIANCVLLSQIGLSEVTVDAPRPRE